MQFGTPLAGVTATINGGTITVGGGQVNIGNTGLNQAVPSDICTQGSFSDVVNLVANQQQTLISWTNIQTIRLGYISIVNAGAAGSSAEFDLLFGLKDGTSLTRFLAVNVPVGQPWGDDVHHAPTGDTLAIISPTSQTARITICYTAEQA